MVEISNNKIQNLAEKTGKALRYMGEVMSCIDKMQDESEMGERNYGGRYGMRSYGGRYGMRDDERWRDEDEMGERRGVPGTGRYGRY